MRDESGGVSKGRKTRSCGHPNSRAPAYEGYRLSRKETILIYLKAAAFAAVTGILFFNSILSALCLLPFFRLFKKIETEAIMEKKKFRLTQDFSDAIGCLAGVLEGGTSIENAISQTYRDMTLSYDKNSMIMKELRRIATQVANGIRIEDAFLGLAERTGLDDVRCFADVFATAKRTGGNIIAIIRETAGTIRDKTEVARELRTVMASKKFESDIMRAVPYLMLAYLRLSSPELLTPLYGNLKGIVFMSVMLGLYAAMSFLAGKIVRIPI